MKVLPTVFEDHEIRRLYDEKSETWFFSVVDIIQVLTEQPDYQAARNYWKVLKNRLAKEGSESVTKCNQLKLPLPIVFEEHATGDRLTPVGDTLSPTVSADSLKGIRGVM